MRDQLSPDGDRRLDGARVLAVALASVTAGAGPDALAAETAAARRRLSAWTERVEAPAVELRRAGRRLAAVIGRLDAARVSLALARPDPGAAARALVDECGRWDRDFIWDVPLRDITRAMIGSAARAVSDELASAHATGDIPDN
jgi:hypothetical protein